MGSSTAVHNLTDCSPFGGGEEDETADFVSTKNASHRYIRRLSGLLTSRSRPTGDNTQKLLSKVAEQPSEDVDNASQDGNDEELGDEVVNLKSESNYDELDAMMAIIKGFVGTGILLSPFALVQGGLAFALAAFGVLYLANVYGMACLIECARSVSARSYGEVGFAASGGCGRSVVNFSILMSQLGFCIVQVVFVANTLKDVIDTEIFHCDARQVSLGVLILAELAVLLPIVVLNNKISSLSGFIIAADVFIFISIVCITGYSFIELIKRRSFFAPHGFTADTEAYSTHPALSPTAAQLGSSLEYKNFFSGPISYAEDIWIRMSAFVNGEFNLLVFNKGGYFLCLGIAAYIWEGITLILPIRASMRGSMKNRFPSILAKTLAGLGIAVTSFAFINALTFGSKTSRIIFGNMAPNRFFSVLQCCYACAVLFGYPLAIFPVTKMIEHFIFNKSETLTIPVGDCAKNYGKDFRGSSACSTDIERILANDPEWRVPVRIRLRVRKLVRLFLVFLTFFIATFAADKLDNLMALIGALCCIPLATIYPLIFHWTLRRQGLVSTSSVDIEIKGRATDRLAKPRGVLMKFEKILPLVCWDFLFLVLGSLLVVFCSIDTIKSWDADHHVATHCEILRSV